MLKAAAIVVVGVPLALLASVLTACFATGVAIVDVREGGPGGQHLIVPVPLLVAQAALACVPGAATRLELGRHAGPELRQQLRAAREVVEALAAAPDGELVRVEEPGTRVLVEKRGNSLQVEVHDGEDDVVVNVPLDVAREAVSGDGTIHASALLGALRQARLTKLVDVRSGNDHVQVSVW